MTRNSNGTLTPEGKKELSKFLWKCFFGTMSTIGAAGVWVLVSEAKQYGHNFVANSPAVIAAQSAVAVAQSTAGDAKAAASGLAEKVDTIITTQSKVFASLTQAHADQQTTLLAVTAIGQHLTDLEKQVDRVEAKQDAIR